MVQWKSARLALAVDVLILLIPSITLFFTIRDQSTHMSTESQRLLLQFNTCAHTS
jgi:hypothetical protein